MWKVDHYITASGKDLVTEFLLGLHRTRELPSVMERIEMLQKYGPKLVLMNRNYAAHLRDQIFELRTKVNNKNIRVLYFFFFHEEIILSHGLPNKEKIVPDSEIDKALEHKRNYLNTHKRHE